MGGNPDIYALLQAAQGNSSGLNPQQPQQDPLTQSMMSGPSSPASPAAPPQAPVYGPRTTGVKGYLSNILYNMGEAGKRAAGLPTDRDIQLQNLQVQNQQMQAQADALEKITRSNLYGKQAEQLGQMVTLPNGVTLPFAIAQKAFPAMVTAQGKRDVEQSKEQNNIDVQNLRNQGSLAVANSRADTLRELTSARIQAMKDISAGRNATTLQAAGMRAQQPFIKAGMGAYDAALQADNRYEQMLQQVANPNPAGDKALLFNHIAMTLGAVKGGRVTEAEINAHLKARSLPDNVMQAWDQLETGKSLTPDQRQNFLKLATEVRNATWEQAYRKADFYGVGSSPADSPNLPPVQAPSRIPPKIRAILPQQNAQDNTPPAGAKIRDYTQIK